MPDFDNRQLACHLINLPPEVQQAIVDALDLPDFLFVPKDGPELDGFVMVPTDYQVEGLRGEHISHFGRGIPKRQHEQYYGKSHTNEEDSAALALLNWSCTCSFFRKTLAPRLARDLVLRTRKKSVRSIEALSKTPLWDSVESMAVRTSIADLGVVSHGMDGNGKHGNRELSPGLEPACLSTLSNLPPNLKTLTLDLFSDWEEEVQRKSVVPPVRRDFACLVRQIFQAVGLNNISDKSYFTLNLINLAGGGLCLDDVQSGCYAYGTDFNQFLGHATTLNLSLCRIGTHSEDEADSIYRCSGATGSIGAVILKHLHKVDTLKIEATPACPRWYFDAWKPDLVFPLLGPATQLHNLRKLTLSLFVIEEAAVRLVCFHAPNLQHLTLLNCAVHGSYDSSLNRVPSTPYPGVWGSRATLFSRLITDATALRSLTLKYHRSQVGLLDPFDARLIKPGIKIGYRKAEEAFRLLQTQDAQRPTMTEREWAQRKPVLFHVVNASHFYAEAWRWGAHVNAIRYLQGEDYRALMELCRAMEARGGEGVICATE